MMVSVIIALYNGSKFIDKTIESVMKQDYRDLELIIVDDCSNDESADIVQKWVRYDSRIVYIRNRSNVGFCRSANHGVRHSKGEYILVLGQDDMLKKNHLSKMVQMIKATEASVVYCDYHCIDEEDNVFDSMSHCKQEELKIMDFLKGNAMPSCGAIQKKVIFEKVGGYPEFDEFPQYGEWYLWIKMIECGRIVFCDEVNADYRRHKNNITNSFRNIEVEKKLEQYWNLCRKLLLTSNKINGLQKIKVRCYIIYKNIRFRMKILLNKYK